MNLYKVMFTHYSQKDSATGTAGFILADGATEIHDIVDEKFEYGKYKDRDEEILNEYAGETPDEHPRDRRIRLCGDMFDDEAEVSDLYYGATQYGWELVDDNPSPDSITYLKKVGLMEE